jgi:ubiquinone/menaquinone biosynthesis C-methylase UbiE
MRMLLDSLVALGLLTKNGDRYGLSVVAAKYLVRGRPEYMGRMIELGDLSEEWRQLTKAVRTGKPARRVEEEGKAVKFFPILVSGLHIINREPAVRAGEALGIGKALKGASVLDIACGSGVWGIAAAEADPAARVTAQDFPAMLRETKKYLKLHRVEKQFDFLPGDLNSVDYGRSRYDVAILGNIVHSEGERRSRQLYRKLYSALRPGGQIAIADMIPNEERTGPPFPVFFALNMLLNTKDGDTYTLAQYAEWLLKAGFERVETHDIGSHSPLIIGIKSTVKGSA